MKFALQKIINQLLVTTTKEKEIDGFLTASLPIIIDEIKPLGFQDRGIIFLKRNNEYIKPVAHQNIESEILEHCGYVKKDNCVCGKAFCSQFYQYKKDLKLISDKNEVIRESNICSFPINYKDNCYGVLTLYLEENKNFTQNLAQEMSSVSSTLGLVIHEKRMQLYADFIKNKLDVSYGDDYFNHLTGFFTQEFKMRYCFIGTYDKNMQQISSVVFKDGAQQLQNITCHLKNSPTEILLKEGFCMFPKNVQTIFPNDKELKEYHAESYVGKLLYNDKNQPVGAIVLMHDEPIDELESQDINQVLSLFTPRLRGECERKLYENNLQLEKEKYRNIIEELQDAFVRTKISPDGNYILEASPSVLRITGYENHEIVGKSPEVFYHDLSQRKAILDKLDKDLKVYNFPVTFVRKNKELVYASVNAQLILDEENNPSEIRMLARDVTETVFEDIRKEIAYIIAKKSQRRVIDLNTISEYLYNMLSRVIDVSNFYISFFNEYEKTIFFPVYSDGVNNNIEFAVNKAYRHHGFFEHVITSKSPLQLNEKQVHEMITMNRLKLHREVPKHLVSFPIRNEGMVVGALSILSYECGQHLCKSDIELLEFVATQLSNIVEREKWQKSLIDKEKYFRTLVESSHEVKGIIDKKGIVQYVSESVKSILGYNAYEMIGKSIIDFIPDNYVEKTSGNFHKIIARPFTHHTDLAKAKAKDGSSKVVHFSLNNQLGNPIVDGIVFNAQDITEKHYAEKSLELSKRQIEEQEKNYRAIFNNANDGIILFDEKLNIIDVNKRFCFLTNYSKETIINNSFNKIFKENLDEELEVQIQQLDGIKHKSVIIERKIKTKTSKQLICKVFIKKITLGDNEKDYYIAFITDVTKRNEASQKALELENALKSSTNLIYVDLQGKIIYANDKIIHTSGYTPKELVGRKISLFNSGYHSKEFFEDLWSKVLSGNVWSGEMRNVRKDGSYFWIFGTIIPIKDINGTIQYFINVRQDITEVKQLKTNSIRDVIDAQEKEKENFAKELHDGLGQILLASKMNLSWLQDSIKKLDKDAQNVYEHSMNLITASIQETRNISHGLMTRGLNQFGLSRSIEDAVNNVVFIDKSLQFEFRHNIEELRFSEEQEKGLYRVLQELITNIIKHSKATRASINIHLEQNTMHITVKDNGVGLTKQFKTLKNSGIGLKNIITRLDYLSGTFTVNENLKKGTEIIIEVPVTIINEEQKQMIYEKQ